MKGMLPGVAFAALAVAGCVNTAAQFETVSDQVHPPMVKAAVLVDREDLPRIEEAGEKIGELVVASRPSSQKHAACDKVAPRDAALNGGTHIVVTKRATARRREGTFLVSTYDVYRVSQKAWADLAEELVPGDPVRK